MNYKKTVAIAAAAGALTTMALPAFAETSLYGSARVATFWNTEQPLQAVGAAKPDTNTDFDLRNQNNSRFGVKASEGNLAGRVELGIGTPGLGTGGNTTVYTRLAYGTCKFDLGTLLVGQNFTPYDFVSQQVALDDTGNTGYGRLYDGRQPQLKMTLNNGMYLAAIRPGGNAAVYTASETFLPKLNVGYEGKAGTVAYGGGVVGQVYKLSSADKQIVSAMGYVHGVVPAGPASIAFNLGVGQNLGEMGLAEGATASVAGTNVQNNFTVSAMVQGTFTASEMVKINVGLGYVTTSGKTAVTSASTTSWSKDDNKMAAFINAPIMLAKNVSVTPELTYIDQLDEKNGNKGAKNYIYGAKWQMDF